MGFCTHRTLTQQNSSCQHLAQQLASYSRVSMCGASLSKQGQTPACKKQGVALLRWMLSLWRRPSRSRQSCRGLCMLLCPPIMATSSYPRCLVHPFSAGKALHFAGTSIAAGLVMRQGCTCALSEQCCTVTISTCLCPGPALRALDPAACCQHNIKQQQANHVMVLKQSVQTVELTLLILCLQCPN